MEATGGHSRKTLALTMVIVIAAASMTVVLAYQSQRGSSVQTLHTTSSWTTSSSQSSPSITTGVTTTNFTDTGLLAECPGLQSSSFGFGTVTTGPSSPAVICLQLYVYSSAPETLNISSILTIQGQRVYADGTVTGFSGSANFTVTESQPQLVIGGPANENEGTTVAFALRSNPGASGTYNLGLFAASGLSAYMLAAQEPLSCGHYGLLVAGNGKPDNAQPAGTCITFATSSDTITVPGVPYPLMPGTYFRILGETNTNGSEVVP